MTHSFEKDYWERHWEQGDGSAATGGVENAANPHLVRAVRGLAPGSALDAGCGTGADALWLAGQGWTVTGADISAAALSQAAERAATDPAADLVTWLEADLTTWEPYTLFDLVVTNYAHPAIPQLAFYDRIAHWVAPGGTLVIVGHLQHSDSSDNDHDHDHGHDHDHDGHPPAEATVTLAAITGRLDPTIWRLDTAEEHPRSVTTPDGHSIEMHDVVVRASRLV